MILTCFLLGNSLKHDGPRCVYFSVSSSSLLRLICVLTCLTLKNNHVTKDYFTLSYKSTRLYKQASSKVSFLFLFRRLPNSVSVGKVLWDLNRELETLRVYRVVMNNKIEKNTCHVGNGVWGIVRAYNYNHDNEDLTLRQAVLNISHASPHLKVSIAKK